MSIDSNLEYVVKTIAETAVDNEKEFGDLDAVVGDGDFGYSLARGFEIVVADWDSFDRSHLVRRSSRRSPWSSPSGSAGHRVRSGARRSCARPPP